MARVVFRCDASAEIGGGHVSRCMALAHALRQRGADIDLVTRDLPQRVREMLVDTAGASVHEIGNPGGSAAQARDEGARLAHADWLPVAQKADAAQTAQVLRQLAPIDWLVVDHYALDARWEREVAPHADNILAIDDLADRDHACDALLDQNFFLDAESRYEGRVPAHAERMLGPRYALLRGEFPAARERIAPHTGALSRVFVCFGGFDAVNQTGRALEAVARAGLDRLAVDVVIGSDHPHREAIETHCVGLGGHRVHIDVTNVAEFLLPADLAIGASGVMNWERAALGVPAIVTSAAENQHIVARDLAAERASIYLGGAGEWRTQTLTALLQALHGTPTLLRALATRAAALTDGDGARRVAARLLPPPIALRRATSADCDTLHAWRNAEESRRHSGDSAPIPLEQHRTWFTRVVDDPNVALLVGERGGRPVGVLRYDVSGATATVSVYLAPGVHGQGLGTALIRAGTRWLHQQRPDVRHLEARIRGDNARSLDAFANAGYRAGSHVYTFHQRHE